VEFLDLPLADEGFKVGHCATGIEEAGLATRNNIPQLLPEPWGAFDEG
jgi:hypothetical protein